MKILYVSQYFPPEMGAPAARAAELSRHWARMGHRSDCPHRISQPSDRRCARGLAVAVSPPSLHGNRRWSERRSHVALAAAQPESARKNSQLRVVLPLGRGQRAGAAEAGRGHRHLSAIAVRTFRVVAGVLEACPFRLRSARSLAGIARRRRRGRRRNLASSHAWAQLPDFFTAAPTASLS